MASISPIYFFMKCYDHGGNVVGGNYGEHKLY